ncbi:MAG TPA: DUF4157 domain-containing protein [Pseudolabrys sp.]|nr:DUF4157 domain-containing protein [Pseudolabrys sp.]
MLHAPASEARSEGERAAGHAVASSLNAAVVGIAPPFAGNQALLRTSAPPHLRPSRAPLLQRQCACGGTCADCSAADSQPKATADGVLQRALQSPAQALAADDQRFFNARFGADFSGVRIHRDADAAGAAEAFSADAFTIGSHIVFGAGRYAPGDSAGRQLLAHELTHVVQQSGDMGAQAHIAAASSDNSVSLSEPGDAAEVEADRNAAAIDGAAPLRVDRAAAGIQRAVTKGCVAPSFVVTPVIASLFGTVAEVLIEPDYIAQKGGVPFADVFLDNPLGPMTYVAFLTAHHPHLDPALLAGQIGLSGGVLVPDILDTRVQELYEIKPDSISGRVAGRGKLAAIDAFMSFNSLPYVRGTAYAPTASIPIPLGGAALAPFLGLPILLSCGIPNVSLSVTRPAAGLILYEICVEADFDCWLKVLTLELMIALIILAILATRGIPIPAPAPVPVLAAGGPEGGAPGAGATPGSAVAQADQGAAASLPQAGEGVPA